MYVCICHRVTDGEIRRAVASGIASVEGLGSQLGVGTGCGRCVECAGRVLREALAEDFPLDAAVALPG